MTPDWDTLIQAELCEPPKKIVNRGKLKEVSQVAFIKVRDKKGKEAAIINTDMICRISKAKNGYTVFFSSGNVGAAYYEYDEAEARKICDAIGVNGRLLTE